jgi:hypothetical protein
MWFLLFIQLIVHPVTLVEHENGKTVLAPAFETFEACQASRNYIGYWMAEAYPLDRSFTIVCRYRR